MSLTFDWPMVQDFIDREEQLALLEEWWTSRERMPINLFGRRRVGKSWLFRRFAHGKDAVLLIAHKTVPGAQLDTFGEKLEPVLGVVPAIPDVATLFRVLFRAARTRKLLVVIDEFPWLLPTTDAAIEAELSKIQAVFEEERDSSKLKLILCGSMVGQMEALQAERGPLHGRLRPMQLQALPFEEASLFLRDLDPVAMFERFAISGGMPRYLATLGSDNDLKRALCRQVLGRDAPLWDEARTILEQEMREPKMYFSILHALSAGPKALNEVSQAVKATSGVTSKYLSGLRDLRLIERHVPIGADPESRSGHWHLRDPFFRFWFRFVFPFQDDIENGLSPENLFDAEIAPVLNDHIAPEFETWCRRWTRANHGDVATKVGAWWGHSSRASKAAGRGSEEIDIVGIGRNRVSVIGEVKWQNRPLGPGILGDLAQHKIPALIETGGFKLANDYRVLLFASAGYTDNLRAAAAEDPRIILVDVATALQASAVQSKAP